MITITIHFLNGAYHATPWGKHVNEGIAEWPPSSWRLLRAIIATWKTTCTKLDDKKIWPILQKLSSEPPHYNLPDASVSHTRHYMPRINYTPTNNKLDLIINTFVVTGNKPLHIIWNNVILNSEETESLQSILKNLHYFGRTESWCTVTLSTESHDYNCSPLKDQNNSEEKDLIRVLVPRQDVEFVDICNPDTNTDNLKSISITTRILQDKNYIDPPGGRWLQYVRPKNCFEEKISHHNKTSTLNDITLIRYAVVGTLNPSIKDTLRIGDVARSACMSRYGKRKNQENSATFSGKDGKGCFLKNHEHAFYLPTYETQNVKIDHLTIIASKGFNKDELDVLFSLKKLYRHNLVDTHLIFQGCGTLDNFYDIPILQKNNKWISATPLILSRHIKYKGKKNDRHIVDGPEEQIRNEIRQRYDCTYELKDIQIDENQTNMYNTNVKPFDFFRWRSHGSVGSGKTYKVKLEFREPVRGPITLGYASHFGLGMFVPLEDIRK